MSYFYLFTFHELLSTLLEILWTHSNGFLLSVLVLYCAISPVVYVQHRDKWWSLWRPPLCYRTKLAEEASPQHTHVLGYHWGQVASACPNSSHLFPLFPLQTWRVVFLDLYLHMVHYWDLAVTPPTVELCCLQSLIWLALKGSRRK